MFKNYLIGITLCIFLRQETLHLSFKILSLYLIQSRFKSLLFGLHVFLRFSGSNFLINLRRQFRARNFVSYTRCCWIYSFLILCLKLWAIILILWIALLLKLAH